MFLGGVIPNVLELKVSWLTQASQTVAKYSYGIYLCHDPILWFAFVKLNWLPVALQWAVLVSLMVLAPLAAHRLLEGPMIDVGRRLASRWTVAPRNEAVLAEVPSVS